MLVNAAFMASVIVLLGATMLQAGLAISRVRIHQAAAGYVEVGYARALTAFETRVEDGIASKSIDPRGGPFPASFSLAAECATSASPCDYLVDEQVTVNTTQGIPEAGSPPGCADPNATNCGHNLQANPYLDEGRVSAIVTVNVSAADGAILATRSSNITLRTFGLAPYVAVAAARDYTFDDVNAGAAAGDDGGQLGDSSNTSDTRVKVIYRNRTTGQETAADSWQDASWSDGSANTTDWSR